MKRVVAFGGRPDAATLRRGFAGQVVLPEESGYHEARRVWNAMVDRRPAIIARCASPRDVAAAVRFARDRGLEIGVRGGGHGVLGLAVPDGGLMIDLSHMSGVRVYPDRRRARVQGGALLGALDRAAQSFGLATTAGNVSHTGVGGLTLRARESDNADLFWGLRGGGGNFGVVTAFEFHLHPVGTAALVADVYYRPEDGTRAMARWRDLIAYAPRQATLTAWSGAARNRPFLPREFQDRPLMSVGYVWVGDPDEGRLLLPALRDAGRAVAEKVEALTYLELQRIDDDIEGHHLRRYWKGHYLRQLDALPMEAFVSGGISDGDDAADPAFLPSGSLQCYGGAIASIGPDETAFGHRDALVEFVARAGWAHPDEDEARIGLARRFGAAMEPFASGVYVNDLTDEGEAGVRRAYGPDKMARLATLKDRYDPDNVFHLNHNVPPASSTRAEGESSSP